MIQVVRQANEIWHVTLVTNWGGNTHEYDLIGRVLRDGDLYYVEVTKWGDTGYTWHRIDHGYQIPRGAIRALCDRNKRLS